LFEQWSKSLQGRLEDTGSPIARPYFPGFEEAFRIPWASTPQLSIAIPDTDLNRAVHIDDRHQRVHETVGVFANRILEATRSEDAQADIWYVVIPDIVYEYCRPQSAVPAQLQIAATTRLGPRLGKRLRKEPSLFDAENTAAIAYEFHPDFHNQLKARLLGRGVLTQVLRESTIWPAFGPDADRPKRDSRPFQAAIAWGVSTASFYKAGGRPWKTDSIRDGVCYIGLVFKQDTTAVDPRSACCAAQMFLDSGDGMVFKGAVGPWYAPKSGEFHLTSVAARELVAIAVKAYTAKAGKPPAELFLHARTTFSDDEWAGFASAVDNSVTNLVGVQIRPENDFRLFRMGTRPVLRGTAYIRHAKSAYLWTGGYAPRLRTYVGLEVPKPLRVEIARGNADIETVLRDILALTKLNYNGCRLADSRPVTLRFAEAIGEILTAAPSAGENPLPFKHYI
jgi:hypothetical protein